MFSSAAIVEADVEIDGAADIAEDGGAAGTCDSAEPARRAARDGGRITAGFDVDDHAETCVQFADRIFDDVTALGFPVRKLVFQEFQTQTDTRVQLLAVQRSPVAKKAPLALKAHCIQFTCAFKIFGGS